MQSRDENATLEPLNPRTRERYTLPKTVLEINDEKKNLSNR
jgi:hypothetical protein